MKTEKEVRARIKELEDYCVDEDTGEVDEYCYLDESQQAELNTLCWFLGINEEGDPL